MHGPGVPGPHPRVLCYLCSNLGFGVRLNRSELTLAGRSRLSMKCWLSVCNPLGSLEADKGPHAPVLATINLRSARDDLTPQLHTPCCVMPRLGVLRRDPFQDLLNLLGGAPQRLRHQPNWRGKHNSAPGDPVSCFVVKSCRPCHARPVVVKVKESLFLAG
jgi:hypothetical protein